MLTLFKSLKALKLFIKSTNIAFFTYHVLQCKCSFKNARNLKVHTQKILQLSIPTYTFEPTESFVHRCPKLRLSHGCTMFVQFHFGSCVPMYVE